jgi:ectoine hydroxylase-related dioxygenase (phytanoyl-CoA dioxygenase family)
MNRPACRLTVAECAAYRRDGFVAGGRIFERETFALALRQIFDLLDRSDADPERMLNWHVRERSLLELARRPEIVDRVAQLIGPHIALFNTRILCKPAWTGSDVPWHQDAPCWPIQPAIVTTFWLAVDAATASNGALRMMPGSHRDGALEHVPVSAGANVFDEAISPRLIDESRAVLVTMRAGECGFHDGFVVHASGPNRTTKRRCAFIARYIPTRTTLDRSQRELYGSDYPLYGIRGDPGRNRYVNR